MKIEKVWFDDEYVFIQTDAGHIVGHPLKWFTRLLHATGRQRANFEISPYGIHWPEIDEDLSLEGFFTYKSGLSAESSGNTRQKPGGAYVSA